MIDWRDAIVELTHLGYSIRTSGNNLHVKWQGKGNPPSKEKFFSLVEVLRGHKEEILNNPYFHIEQALREINEIWQPGFLNFLKFSKPKEWKRIRNLEEKINQDTFEGDLNQLKETLNEYQQLIIELVKKFGIISKQNKLSFQQNSSVREKEYGT